MEEKLVPGEFLGELNGIKYHLMVNLDDVLIPENAKDGDELGWINCSCQRVHRVSLRNGGKHVDTGWY